MAITKKHQHWINWSNVAVPVKRGKIYSGQGLYVKDSPCYLSTAGVLKLVDTSDGSDALTGFFMDHPTTEHSANAAVYWANLRACEGAPQFLLYGETSGTDLAFAQANVGNTYGIAVSSTAGYVGYTTVDVGNSNKVVLVEDLLVNSLGLTMATPDVPTVAPTLAIVSVLASIVAGLKG